jgi:hypothetical protein
MALALLLGLCPLLLLLLLVVALLPLLPFLLILSLLLLLLLGGRAIEICREALPLPPPRPPLPLLLR